MLGTAHGEDYLIPRMLFSVKPISLPKLQRHCEVKIQPQRLAPHP